MKLEDFHGEYGDHIRITTTDGEEYEGLLSDIDVDWDGSEGGDSITLDFPSFRYICFALDEIESYHLVESEEKFDVNDVVEVTRSFDDLGVTAGERGTVVCCCDQPSEAYEVEFVDGSGATKAQFGIEPEDLKLVWKYQEDSMA